MVLNLGLRTKAKAKGQGPVVQSIVSLTSSLRCQLVKYFTTFMTKYTEIFVDEKRSFCTICGRTYVTSYLLPSATKPFQENGLSLKEFAPREVNSFC